MQSAKGSGGPHAHSPTSGGESAAKHAAGVCLCIYQRFECFEVFTHGTLIILGQIICSMSLIKGQTP